jgi:hypothetical protein
MNLKLLGITAIIINGANNVENHRIFSFSNQKFFYFFLRKKIKNILSK